MISNASEILKNEILKQVKEAAQEKVKHPLHYNTLPAECAECHHPIECIDVVQHLNFNRGNAIKYIWRAGAKVPGSIEAEIEDLKKSEQYIIFEIKRLEKILKQRENQT
jgi:hypothetical protein